MSILAESPPAFQSVPIINTALPVFVFFVAMMVMASLMGKKHRAVVARMSPEERLKLFDSQWQKRPWFRPWIGMIFILPLIVLPSFIGSLGQWLFPVFACFLALLVLGMFWEGYALAKRGAAAGLPADYIAACKRHSLVTAALATGFMVWLLFDMHRVMTPLRQSLENLTALERRLTPPKEPAIREREIGQHPPDH